MNNPDIAIIGGGPAGLSAGYEAAKTGSLAVVLEAEPMVGGLSKTLFYKGFGFDIGGHRFFTKIEPVNDLWRTVLPDDFLVRQRLSRIYYQGKFFRYPLRLGDAMFGLRLSEAIQVLGSFLKARLTPNRVDRSLEDWVVNRFGKQLYSIFFKAYTEKVWGIPCNELSADWAAQRIRNLNLVKAALNAFGFYRKGDAPTLAESFHYPRKGPGQLYEAMQAMIKSAGSTVLTKHNVVEIRHENSQVRSVVTQTSDGKTEIEAEHFISSMPIDDLVRSMSPTPPRQVLNAAAALSYRGILTANLLVDSPSVCPDNWIYLHSPSVHAGRMQFYGNWSPDLVPDAGRSSVGLEYFASKGDALWSRSDGQMLEVAKEDLERLGLVKPSIISDGCVVRYQKAYPIYDIGYAVHLGTIRKYLAEFSNLQCIGRAGQFRYNNMDHSIFTGMLAVRKIGGQDVDPWSVNEDAAYLEAK